MPDTNNKPVIFLAFANDRDDNIGYLRNLPVEARKLREVLERAEQAGLCEVVSRSSSTAGDIFKVFQDPRYRNRVAVFHFGGHANGYQLLLESPEGRGAAADAGGLAAFIGQQQGLKLVFLNGCSTQQQTQGLLDANIPAVISTSRAIDDQVATDFASQFYQGLSGGASIRTAYHEAESAVQTAKGGNMRGLYFGDEDDPANRLEADRWPWNLYLRDGSAIADQWNLPDAVNDPMFGLPPLSELDLPESPYRHLYWFTRKDAEVFFGRGHQIRELYDRLSALRTAPIILFYGQTGVGKSSILDAGLLPRLERSHEVRYLRRGEGGLLKTLQRALSTETPNAPVETAWRMKEEQLKKPLIIILDQVEELYTRPISDMPDELDQLLKAVKATFGDPQRRPNGKLVLGFRKEWLAELESQLVAHELPRTKVFLEPLDRRGIIEVVSGPARTARLRERYGLTIEHGLAEIIADDLLEDRDSAIAPTLQILLTKMWTKATEVNLERPAFSRELYQQLKRDGILLRDFLNQQFGAFRQRYPEAVDSGLLLDIVALHTTALGTAEQCTVDRLQQQYAHLGTTLPAILRQCQDLYLLSMAASTQNENGKTTRLAHDTLAPLVRQRFDESDRPGQRALRVLQTKAAGWVDQCSGDRLDKTDLSIVEKGASGMRVWSANERRLIEASRTAHWWNRVWRFATAASLALAVIVGLWYWRSADMANLQRSFAERDKIDRLIEENMKNGVMERDQTKNVPKAIHLFLQAEQWARQKAADPTTAEPQDASMIANARLAARFLLRGAHLSAMFDMETKSIGGNWPIGGVAFDATESRVVAWTKLPTVIRGKPTDVRVFDAQSGLPVSPRLRLTAEIYSASLNVAGTRVLAHDMAGNCSVWDITSGTESAQVVVNFPNEEVVHAIFLPDGQSFFVARNGNWSILDAANGNSLHSQDASFGRVINSHFSSDGTHMLAWTDNAFVGWQVQNEAPKLLLEREEGSQVLFVAPDLQKVVIRTAGGWTQVLNPFTGELSEISFGSGEMQGAFSNSNGSQLLIVNENEQKLLTWNKNEVRVWDSSSGQTISPVLLHRSRVTGATFSPSGRKVISWSDDGLFRLWSLEKWQPREAARLGEDSPGKLSSTLTTEQITKLVPSLNDDQMRQGMLSPKGSRVLTWGDDGVARIWDTISGEPLTPAMRHEIPLGDGTRAVTVEWAAFDIGGDLVLTLSGHIVSQGIEPVYGFPQFLRIWSSRTGLPLSPKLWESDPMERAEFVGDQRIAAMSSDSRRELVLPPPSDVPDQYQILDAEVRTGTSLTKFGEFVYLTVEEWRDRNRTLKSVVK